ncbi:Cx9C motif-containing protein 4, mitochondrial [Metschnikowia bicuspidata var. bicuspidata NRRL YB-4993]|uniref:Cx9C motif-containing protein 4, mitochondrial n=1 Tax=Metschnikowia bicuspidata var. bicuspidata NRRL YB-4993 TaxID=869754 RepID=A0A1A0H7S8_9ASCO|nr:Cx9C motif-containing protein 4, mitochondrial [Metschnikowia bicuspidata var. bicuspidata NRRL YB-4993]OBA19947.1 Cx9C motif-containing protein 4, mitochondrial [Metschnikowia bicuspidata var. bicuspidata NRRL YB-4993]
MSDESNACKPFACAIQDCLKQNGYNEARCTAAIDELYRCCKLFYEDNGPEAKSVCCPKFNLLQLKLKQRLLRKIDAELILRGR